MQKKGCDESLIKELREKGFWDEKIFEILNNPTIKDYYYQLKNQNAENILGSMLEKIDEEREKTTQASVFHRIFIDIFILIAFAVVFIIIRAFNIDLAYISLYSGLAIFAGVIASFYYGNKAITDYSNGFKTKNKIASRILGFLERVVGNILIFAFMLYLLFILKSLGFNLSAVEKYFPIE